MAITTTYLIFVFDTYPDFRNAKNCTSWNRVSTITQQAEQSCMLIEAQRLHTEPKARNEYIDSIKIF